MITELKNIAPLVKNQFPSFYEEDGDNFLQFVKAYYEWLDETSIGKARNLYETSDIDSTADEYVKHFIAKYMHGIPASILSNRRLLEKHILDVYRSKGSIEGLKLLFRLLYKEEISVYIPSVDILKASDGNWVKRKYLEVYNTPKHYQYDNQFVRGASSGATAFISDAATIYLNNSIVHVLYISDEKPGPTGDSFRIGERILYDGLDIKEATWVKGSAVSAYVDGSMEDNDIGDVLVSNNIISGQGVKFNVATTIDPTLGKGYITFKLRDGGNGYTLNSNVTVTYGTTTTGSGATFKVGSLKDTSQFNYVTNLIAPVVGTALNSTDYGSTLNNALLSTTLDTAFNYNTVTVGTIASLTGVTSGDHNYNGSVLVNVHEPITYGYNIIDSNGNLWGNNAIVTGNYATGNGIISSVSLMTSGYGFNTQGETLEFYNTANNSLLATLIINIGGVGVEEGEWVDNNGHLNSDKYIQDSYYYQEYSYEIQMSKSLDKYIEVLKQLGHPVGNRLFGKAVISSDTNNQMSIVTQSVTQNI
ncbi:hypothetical protein UFOVP245_120 [uncultured Caudovirales phage]|uniref:Baseplate wedge subunit n=1 Tax=uncultured Caudovirales phage TaxID=2100421 RepID=A0A6J7WT81_9CAUD|nr:hypothetical protein UFOVP245_120 [uncultured Caudovirales phage]